MVAVKVLTNSCYHLRISDSSKTRQRCCPGWWCRFVTSTPPTKWAKECLATLATHSAEPIGEVLLGEGFQLAHYKILPLNRCEETLLAH
mmetsp:Transcript_3741/g.6228  ORF Transcript_3741/g.6228 Transcript_3741/m.6228 type:complete len:89 (+) Transcript_3741:765-1031(+)